MRTVSMTIAAITVLLAMPVAAQDFLAPLQEMVDQLTGPTEKPQRPQGAAPKPVEVAPIPRPRPPDLPKAPAVATPVSPAAEEPEAAPAVEEEPIAEPVVEDVAPAEADRVYQVACPAVIRGLVEADMAPPLSEGICGEQSPLLVTGVLVNGRMVPLSSPITTNCQMASALPGWAETVDGYARSMLDSALATINTGTSYMCRGMVGGETGRMSEHGFANAVDVTGFTLEDGRSIGVEADWMPAAEPEGRLLRLAHDAACGDFMTVLGPEANAEHHDHLHLDLGCHGLSCQARICE